MEILQFLENKDLQNFDNLVSILQFRALHEPQKEAFTFLSDGIFPTTLVNYKQLDQAAKSIAALLQGKAMLGERALLFYTPGPEYIKALFGCLYAGVIPVPIYASNGSHLSRNLASLLSIVQDAKIKVILSDSDSMCSLSKIIKEIPGLDKNCGIATDTINYEAGHYLKPDLTKTTTAIMQYTSGSTSMPKGVILSHSNLLTNIKAILYYFSVKTNSRGIIWLPPYHDMGLIGGIFTPVIGGFPVTLMSPVSFIQDPLFWLKTITNYKGTISGGPNFAFDYCVKRMKKRPHENLDLSSWEIAFCGAEPINPKTIDNFIDTFSPFGLSKDAFQACYGLAESSLMVTTCLASKRKQPKSRYFYTINHKEYKSNSRELNNDNKNIHRLVSCGSIIDKHELTIVDPTNLINVQDGTVGEIWVRGPSVAAGYWNKSKETQEIFNAVLAKDKSQSIWLRTGDLGFLYDNELFVTGRLKELIIIRGRNYYPQDIEHTSRCSHPRLDTYPSTVFSIVSNNKEQVIIIQEIPKKYSGENLREILAAIQKNVSEKHDLFITEIILVKAGSIPKTSSGKIKRIACKEQYLSSTLDVLITLKDNADFQDYFYTSTYENKPKLNDWPHLLMYLKKTIKSVFKLSATAITEDTKLTDLGIDSLGLVELKHHIDQELNVEMDLTFLLSNPTLREFAYYLISKLNKDIASTTDIKKEECTQLALTDSQKAMWFLSQLNSLSSAQIITRAIQITGSLNMMAFIQSLEIIVQRHPSLRSTFSSKEGEPFQIFHENILPETIQICEAQLWDEQKLEAELINLAYRPFKLAKGPLLRFIIFCCSENKFILLFSAHHIILDFWSFSILFEELFNLYVIKNSNNNKNEIVLQNIVHPKAYFEWYSNYSNDPKFEHDWQYWKEKLARPLPQSKLKQKFTEINRTENKAERYNFQISELISVKVEEYSKKCQTTPYVILLSAFYALLYRLTKQDDIIVGSPVATRNWPGGNQLVGYCVNILPLRIHLSENLNFTTLIKKVKYDVNSALKHQDFPFSVMVEKLKLNRKENHRPILNIAFMYQQKPSALFKNLSKIAVNGAPTEFLFENLTLKSISLRPSDIQFELIFSMTPTKEGIFCSMEYETRTIDRELIRMVSLEYSNILEKLMDFEQQSISQHSLIFEDVFSNALILDQNDKILPEKSIIKFTKAHPHVAPRNTVEIQIAKMWENLSNQNDISVYDNFFELGGSSLLSVKLANQLSNTFHINIDVSKIFEFQTVAGLAEYIQNYCKFSDVSDSTPIKKVNRVPYVPKNKIEIHKIE